MLEFGHLYMRVVMNGGHVLEPASTVTAITCTNPCVVTAPAHGFSNGDEVVVQSATGMTNLNGGNFKVASQSANTFSLTDLDDKAVDSSAWSAYAGGASVARVFTLTTPYMGSDLARLKYTQSADVMTFCHTSYAPMDLSRSQHWAWSLAAIVFRQQIQPPTTVSAANSGAGSQYYRYVVTAQTDSPSEESLPSATADCCNAALNQNTGIINTISWAPMAEASRYRIYKAPIGTTKPIPAGSIFGYIGSTTGTSFDDANIQADTSQTPPQGRDPFALSPLNTVTITSGGGNYTAPVVSVSDPTGSGAILVPIIDISGAITAMIVQNGGSNYSNPTLTITDASGSGAVLTATISTEINHPGCVTYYQQRKVFAGSGGEPETVWMSQTGNFHNMDVSSPSRADDSITLTVASRQVNAVKHLVSVNALLALTASGAFKISGGGTTAALTPTQTVVQPQAYNGCSDITPLVVNYDILYVQSKGSTVRDLSYNFYVDLYTGNDLTVMSSHLFFGYQIIDWCWAEEPFKLVWAVRDDGVVLSLTYLKEQDVYAWCHHDTLGSFLSTASIPEGAEDAVYFVVSRTLPGVAGGQPVSYVERLASRNLLQAGAVDITRSWFVDCGLQYQGSAISNVSGLGHLEGASVAILADGNVQPPQVVKNGAITLQHPASTITAGLPFTADLATLDLDTGDPTIQGRRKKISAVTLKLENSRGLQVGPDSSTLVEIKDRSTQAMGTAVPLKSGDERILISPTWSTQGSLWVRQDNPLPCTVLGVIPEVRIGDGNS